MKNHLITRGFVNHYPLNTILNILIKRHQICSDQSDEWKSKIQILEDKVRNLFEKNRKLKSDIENATVNEGNSSPTGCGLGYNIILLRLIC